MEYVLDYALHTLAVLITVSILEYKQKPLSLWLALLVNLIYVSQYLNASRRLQYCSLMETLLHFTQAICNPGASFCIAAVHSYLSFSRLKVSLLAMLLSYHRDILTLVIFKMTGSRASWLLKDLLQDSTVVLESHFIFALTAGFIRTTSAYRSWAAPRNSDSGNNLLDQQSHDTHRAA